MEKKIDGGVIVGLTADGFEEKKNAKSEEKTAETVNVSTAEETLAKTAKKPIKRARK